MVLMKERQKQGLLSFVMMWTSTSPDSCRNKNRIIKHCYDYSRGEPRRLRGLTVAVERGDDEEQQKKATAADQRSQNHERAREDPCDTKISITHPGVTVVYEYCVCAHLAESGRHKTWWTVWTQAYLQLRWAAGLVLGWSFLLKMNNVLNIFFKL